MLRFVFFFLRFCVFLRSLFLCVFILWNMWLRSLKHASSFSEICVFVLQQKRKRCKLSSGVYCTWQQIENWPHNVTIEISLYHYSFFSRSILLDFKCNIPYITYNSCTRHNNKLFKQWYLGNLTYLAVTTGSDASLPSDTIKGATPSAFNRIWRLLIDSTCIVTILGICLELMNWLSLITRTLL